MKSLCLALLLFSIWTVEALDRPKLRIPNAGPGPVEAFWLAPEDRRVPKGEIEPGRDFIPGASIGNRLVILDAGQEAGLLSMVPAQAFRCDPNEKDYRNDFHPFVRAEIHQHAPTHHNLLTAIGESSAHS